MSVARGSGVAVGGATLYPAGSVADEALSTAVAQYRRTVAGRYRALRLDDVGQLPPGPLFITPKVDGELWFAACTTEGVSLVSPTGRVLAGSLPLLDELSNGLGARAGAGALVAGELFALRRGARPRVGDVGRALGSDGDPSALGFIAFDVVALAGDETPPDAWSERHALLAEWLAGGKRAQSIKLEAGSSPADVRTRFETWVDGGKAEGLVVRSADGRIFKLKPSFELDCVVVGFTEREDDSSQVRSLLLGLQRADGAYQVVGALGNVGSEADRATLHARLADSAVASDYRAVSGSGAMYRFVAPRVVLEVSCTDLQTEDSAGEPVRQWALSHGEGGWSRVCRVAGASLVHPVLSRVREDKAASRPDIRVEQLSERVEIAELDRAAEATVLPASQVVRREVYTQETKGKLAVRKLLVWKTNKETVDPDFPAFVVHWTDYSSGRKKPLAREVRPAPTLEEAQSIAEAMLAKGLGRGWKPAETP